jgi:hypothetical protein
VKPSVVKAGGVCFNNQCAGTACEDQSGIDFTQTTNQELRQVNPDFLESVELYLDVKLNFLQVLGLQSLLLDGASQRLEAALVPPRSPSQVYTIPRDTLLDTTPKSSEQKIGSGFSCLAHPCKARGMPVDHNATVSTTYSY